MDCKTQTLDHILHGWDVQSQRNWYVVVIVIWLNWLQSEKLMMQCWFCKITFCKVSPYKVVKLILPFKVHKTLGFTTVAQNKTLDFFRVLSRHQIPHFCTGVHFLRAFSPNPSHKCLCSHPSRVCVSNNTHSLTKLIIQ